jgi:hypothetical protein
MPKVNIQYTGNIPGLGKGPFKGLLISRALYARLKTLGYHMTVLEVMPKRPSQEVIKSIPVEEVVVEKVITPSEHPVHETVLENEKLVVADPLATEEVKSEQAVPAVKEVKLTYSDIEDYTKEDLEDLLEKLSPNHDRPVRYGCPWLLRTIKPLL